MSKPKFRKPLPKRFLAAMSEDGHARLRALAARSGLSNNYVLTAVFEHADELIDPEAFDRAVAAMLESARVRD